MHARLHTDTHAHTHTQKLCCIGVARDYHALRRYNLHEILKGDKEKAPSAAPATDAAAEAGTAE